MTTALVFGAGGPLGIAWQLGLLAGIAGQGVDLASADFVLGTSAGSVAGAALTAGLDLPALARHLSVPLQLPPGADGDLLAQLSDLAATATDPADPLRPIINHALSADTLSEADWVGQPLFAATAGLPWPPAFRCSAVDIGTGRLRVFDAGSAVDLPAALAASCAVPGVFPPVSVGGTQHIDGGMYSPLNTSLAAGHDRTVVVSCFPLTSGPGGPMAAGPQAEIDHLRSGGSEVVVIEPGEEFLRISEWGAAVMDTSRAESAFRAGLGQGGQEELALLS